MKFEAKIAEMRVEQIIEEISKNVKVIPWNEEVLFFNSTYDKQTLIDWEVCKGCLSKCKSASNRKKLDVKAWVNIHKWTEHFSKEYFIEFLITNFFDEEQQCCTQKAWGYLPYVIENAFTSIDEEIKKG